MSSAEVLDPPAAVPKPSTGGNHSNNKHAPNNKFGNNNNNKRKSKHERSLRKRSKSFNGCGLLIQPKPVLPSKFLLGGNIKDPLNLNSLQDEEINRAMNAVTPKSSPVPTPPRKKAQLEVIIPKNIHDPLNLTDCPDDDEYEQQMLSPIKKAKKKRLKKRRTMSATLIDTDLPETVTEPEAKTPELSTDSAKVPDVPENAEKSVVVNRDLSIELGAGNTPKKDKPQKRKSDDYAPPAKKFKNPMDKIVSPVVPQPGAWLIRSNSVSKRIIPRPIKNPAEELKIPQFKEKDKRFQYGNYNRYYGYRNLHNEVDHRLRVFSHHAYLFENKDILDVGCNIGHITLCVARDFRAKSVTAIDIDPKLISIARKNVKHYVKTEVSPSQFEDSTANASSSGNATAVDRTSGSKNNKNKKSSFHDARKKGKGFPNNVTFQQCNYILEDDNQVALDQPQFDVILCLSVTKWIHLNWGDAGLKQAFRRMYAQLRPGGRLILEPQHWASYKSKKKLTETIYKNYNSIEFFPDKFREYLLSPVVGFAKSEILGFPFHQSKGFRRPILVFTKSTMFPSERIEATPIGSTPHVCSSFGSEPNKTEKYESRTQPECNIEHVYTDLLDTRYCGCEDDNIEMNNTIGEELKTVVSSSDGIGESSLSPLMTRSMDNEEEEYRCGSDRTENSQEFGECASQEVSVDGEDNNKGDGGGVNSVGDNT